MTCYDRYISVNYNTFGFKDFAKLSKPKLSFSLILSFSQPPTHPPNSLRNHPATRPGKSCLARIGDGMNWFPAFLPHHIGSATNPPDQESLA